MSKSVEGLVRLTITVEPSAVSDMVVLMELHRLGAFSNGQPHYNEGFGLQGAYVVSVEGDNARYLLALIEEGARQQSLPTWEKEKANPSQLSLPGSTS